jgi:hypothetical protein
LVWSHNAGSLNNRPILPTVTPTANNSTILILPTATLSAQPTNTAAPVPTNTAVPTSTATPVPSCTLVFNGTAQLNDAQTYLNLDTGQVSNLATDAYLQLQFSPAGPDFAPVTGSQTAGLAGSSYESVTCAQLRGLNYGTGSEPATPNAVFAMKLPNGHLAKVLVTAGAPTPALQWSTYNP